MCIFSFLFFFFCSTLSFTQTEASKLLNDIQELGKLIDSKHVAPYRLVSKKDLQSKIDDALKVVKEFDGCNEVCYVELLKIIAALNDGHSVMQSSSRNKLFGYMPFSLKWFQDGLYLVRTTKEKEVYLGSRLETINNVPIEEVLKELRTILPHGNDSRFKKYAFDYIRMPGLLYALGITKSPKEAILQFSKNGTKSLVVYQHMEDEIYGQTTFVSYVNPEAKLPYSQKNPNDYYWFEYDNNNNIFYVQYNRIGNMKKERASAFAQRMWTQVDSLNPEKFVLDLRDNGGGQFAYSMSFIQGILDRSEINQRGRLFIVSGYNTFSAALDMVRNLEVRSEAIIIGEPPGDYAASSGDGKTFVLPNTQIKVQLSTVFHPTVFENDNRSEILLDHYLETSWKDYAKGIDPLYEYIKEYQQIEATIADSKSFQEKLGRYTYDAEKDLLLRDQQGKLFLEISKSLITPLYTTHKRKLFDTEVKGLQVKLEKNGLKLYFPDGQIQSFARKNAGKSALELIYSGQFEKAKSIYLDIIRQNPKNQFTRDGRFSNLALFAFYELRKKSREEASKIAKGILNLSIELNNGNAPQSKFALRFY